MNLICLSVHQSVGLNLKNGSLVFSDFLDGIREL